MSLYLVSSEASYAPNYAPRHDTLAAAGMQNLVAPVKVQIGKSLSDGKSLKDAAQDAKNGNPQIEEWIIAQAAILAREEWAAQQQAQQQMQHPPQSAQAGGAAAATPPNPLVQAGDEVDKIQLFQADSLAKARQALEHPGPGGVGNPLQAPTGAQVGGLITQIALHRQTGVSLEQAINLVRIDAGGEAVDEQALAEAVLAMQGQQHLDALADNGDPIEAAGKDVAALGVFADPVLDAAVKQMTAAAPGPDQGVEASASARATLAADEAAHADAATLANDRNAVHVTLSNQLMGLYPSADGAAFLSDPTRVDMLWKAQYQVMRGDLGAQYGGAGKKKVSQEAQQADSEKLYMQIEAAILLRKVQDTQGGADGTQYLAAMKQLTRGLQGMGATPGTALYDEVIGPDPAHPADAGVAELLRHAADDIVARGGSADHLDGDAVLDKLAAVSKGLNAYQHTVLDAAIAGRVMADPAMRQIFDAAAPPCEGNEHDKLARARRVFDAAAASPLLANALYEAKYKGQGADCAGGLPDWLRRAAGNERQSDYYVNASHIYEALGGMHTQNGRDLLTTVLGRMQNEGGKDAVKTGDKTDHSVPAGAPSYSKYETKVPIFGVDDAKKHGEKLQLLQDIVNDNEASDFIQREITDETEFKDQVGVDGNPNDTQLVSGDALAGLGSGEGLQAVTSMAQAVNLLGQQARLTPVTPHTDADWRAVADGTFLEYDPNAKVGNTTLLAMLQSMQRAQGVREITEQTPLLMTFAMSMYWTG